MRVTRHQLTLVLAVTGLYLLGQLSVGTDPTVASLFTVAILFGLLSVFAGGGLKSAFGCLNAILIGKFLLVGIALKIVLLQPADFLLSSPQTSALVMAVGFFGVFLGTAVQSRVFCPGSWSMNRPVHDRMLLSFSIVLFVASYLGYFAAMLPATEGQGLQTGGWLGIARGFGSLKSLAIVPPMLYLWRTNAARWMTHPVILCMLCWAALVGIFSTTKQDALEPLTFYLLVGFLRYGWRDSRLWLLVSIGAAYYLLLVFPYSQYIRHAGGREGSFEHRFNATANAFWRMTSDEDFRSTVSDRVNKAPYFEHAWLGPFGRLAMISEADNLIAATEKQRAFTGWETIVWGFKLMTPSLLFPNKPKFEAGNYLAHIAGEVGGSDITTQVSYGIMANLYNAFSLSGVLFGSPLFFAGFYFWLRLFFGNPTCDGTPTVSTLWFIWLVGAYQHSLVESSVSGVIASLSAPFLIAVCCLLAKWLLVFSPREVCA